MSSSNKEKETDLDFREYYISSFLNENKKKSTRVELCSATRNSMIRLHNEANKTLSNEATCHLLKNQLLEYSQILHDDSASTSVNSFAKPIEFLLKGKVSTTHCSSWKSNLKFSDIDPVALMKQNLEELGHCNIIKDMPCSQKKYLKEDVKLLFENKTIPDVDVTIEHLKHLLNSPQHLDVKPSIDLSLKQNGNQQIINKNIFKEKSNNVNHDIKNNSSNNSNSTIVNTKTFPVYKKMRIEDTDNSKKINNASTFNNKFKRKYTQNNHEENNDISEDKKLTPDSCFKTARAELMIQNSKKYGNPYQDIPSDKSNNVQKRSLGTMRSIQSKFVPPMASNNVQDSDNNYSGNNEIQDERLKHIDPKMVELIRSEIIDSSTSIAWDDIAGLDFAKTAIQEAVVWPLLRPDIFTGLRRPPRGILLFGPPGTGKTLIGKCIASQCNATFFSISASSLTSKWLGDGEKMVRALFAVARCHQPAVVFIDEIDSLLTQRSDTEHEATRRIKTEFLVQLDGAATGDEDRLLLIGATNRPQELDEAARRRLVKRLYIPLPDKSARKQLINRLMKTEKNSLSDEDVDDIANLTDGFSGADMRSLCSEAALGPIRALPMNQICNINTDQVNPVSVEDFKTALKRVRPSVSGVDLEQYTKWDTTYGSGNNM